MSRRILITGASIAGNTAAWWLGQYGLDVTVVERASEFRDGGQNIDIRGVGREVLRRMDLEQVALDQGTGEEGTIWIDEEGKEVARFVTDELGSDGPTAEMEILRGDLAHLLYEPARERATFRFGDWIDRIENGVDGVSVSFASERSEHYDAIIIAEGVGSATRELVFPGENEPRWMDLTIAYFTIPRQRDDDRMWRWYNATEGRSISLRPDTHGTTRAMLSLQQPPNGEQEWSAEKQKAYLRERFANAGWQAGRVLAAMDDTDDFYFDVRRQVRMDGWSKGPVVLTGDAAWCNAARRNWRHTGSDWWLRARERTCPFQRCRTRIFGLRRSDAAAGRKGAGGAEDSAAYHEPSFTPWHQPPAQRPQGREQAGH
ncbi:FAD-dependent monooxygenase [Neorhizobium sp. DAR64861/K0K2]|uniref:FAD-dependent monooxygenase n=1 Tax=unclassified Neorhizobium TaxID=2629175 RepID=UPI003D2B6D92